MAEVITQEFRISAIAKELNVSYTHLIETLQSKGFEVENKPTVKISGEMRELLFKEYSQDLADKKQADKIALGSKVAKEETPPVTTAKVKEKESTPAAEPVPPAPPKEELPETKRDETPEEEKTEKAPKKIRAKAGTLEGPKVVGTVPLETLKGKPAEEKAKKKTAAKKSTKKKDEPAPEEKPAETIVPEVTAEVPPPVAETPKEEKTPPPVEMIKTEYRNLEGPKVIGKVDLSTIKGDRPDYRKEAKAKEETQKRKRKRIYSSDLPARTPGSGGGTATPRTDGRPDLRRDGGRRSENPAAEVSEKQIQDKIRETMARLGGATRGKTAKSKYRRIKREEVAAEEEAAIQGQPTTLRVTEFISASELSNLLNVPVTEVIKKCMDAGVIVSINQRLDAEIIELVAGEFGQEVQFISMEEQDEKEVEADEDDPALLKPRPPIVTIMGHVDHGKTSLLDFIRQTNVVAGEKGGITQHIGAYEVVLENQKRITFLDTPGHEAFTAMRARGAKITDIAVIVIAADDAVMPQTREAISHAQAAGVPMIFAFNKMDKPGASADRIRQQLAELNILVEEWGGKFQTQEISARQGEGIDTLLDKILLEADLLDLKANPDRLSTGTVLEATLDKGRGYVATLLVQQGTLNIGDVVVAGNNYARIKAMYNERGIRVKDAGPAVPVQILGLDGAPQAGEKFKEFADEHDAKQVAYKRQQILREQGIRTKKHITLDEIGRRLALGNFKELNVIVKGDFDGSIEALTDSMLKLSNPEIQVNVIHKAVGQITESDVILASASDAIIIGFQVRPSLSARKLAEKENIEIRLYSIIYDATEELKSAMEGMLEPKIEEKITGVAEVREVFNITKVGKVAGCYMSEGKIVRSNKARLIRDGIVIYTGELSALKRFKDDVKEVVSGQECGISIKNFNDIKVGDNIEGFEETEVKRKL